MLCVPVENRTPSNTALLARRVAMLHVHSDTETTPEAEKPPDKAAKHIWFADDSGAAGKLKVKALKIWWDALQLSGPAYGYYPKPSKTWLIVKEEHKEEAESLFPA